MLPMTDTVESLADEQGIPSEKLLRVAQEIGISKQSAKDTLSRGERSQLQQARTVKDFADKLGIHPDRLLAELDTLGVSKASVDAYLSRDKQWQREAAQSVETLAHNEGITADRLLRKLEDIGQPKASAKALVTADEQEQISSFVRSQRIARTIRTIREHRGMTRATVADQIGVSQRQMVNIEAGEVDIVDPRHAARLEKLAVVLDVKIKDFYGPPPTDGRSNRNADDLVEISVRIPSKARTGLEQIRNHYGWTIAQVMEVSSLMFVLLAEGSLARRRQRVAELRSMFNKLPEEMRFDEFHARLEREEGLIQSSNLRQDGLSEGKSLDPLSAYLYRLAGEQTGDAVPDAPAGDPRQNEQTLLDWLLSRGRCPACHEPVRPEFVHCPACGQRIEASEKI